MSSSQGSSPPPYAMSSVPETTPASSPPRSEFTLGKDASEYTSSPEPELVDAQDVKEDEEFEARFARLSRILEKSYTYSGLLKQQMDKEKQSSALRSVLKATAPAEPSKKAPAKRGRKGRKKAVEEEPEEETKPEQSPQKEEPNKQAEEQPKFVQPSLVIGAQLKDYQLEGVEWMISLDKNGVSGILADEMGLGKTLQTIAFNAYLREQGNFSPFLVVCPLSVLHNWIEEYNRFAPDIPVCMYHGSPIERAELRTTAMRLPDVNYDSDEEAAANVNAKPKKKAPAKKKAAPAPKAATRKSQRQPQPSPSKPSPTRRTRSGRPTKRAKVDSDGDDDPSDSEDQAMDEDEEDEKEVRAPLPPQTRKTFPVVVTTYEMIIRDRAYLAAYNWGYIVVDEGHRLKNLDCRLMQEIKKYPSAGRMILTGTPLHNNLSELWALLNFVLPDIFNDLDAFQEWFNLGAMQSHLTSEQSSELIHTLHGILKPFLLRRLKADVEGLLPPKKEYVLYAPLTVRQRDLYDTIVEGNLRQFLLGQGKGVCATEEEEEKRKKEVEQAIETDAPRKLRKGKRRRYDVDGDDDAYFEMLENGEVAKVSGAPAKDDLGEMARQHQLKTTLKQVNNMKLQNTVMQLRKVCSHPFLFDWPIDASTSQPVLDDSLVGASGKMMVLDRLLTELFKRGHRVLLFSQFTTMLDIIDDWARELKGWDICRIDGSSAPLERREQMNIFQAATPDSPRLFLLSTRAGGLGINLTAADTVIFYDQDWNPQMDVQAQDRAHRIGQTKPVLIFRLISAHTIETRIMQRATEKRKLEALVIAKGKFKMPGQAAAPRNGQRAKRETMAELAASLLRLEGEQIDVVPDTAAGKASVLSDAELDMLLDRREEVFSDRGKGWTSSTAAASADAEGAAGAQDEDQAQDEMGVQKKAAKAAFAAYEAPVGQGNEALAKILGEDAPE